MKKKMLQYIKYITDIRKMISFLKCNQGNVHEVGFNKN